MKKFSFLLSNLLLIVLFLYGDDTPSYNTDNIEPSSKMISELIAKSFLQARKNAIRKEDSFVNEYTVEKKIFGLRLNHELQDIKMTINREVNNDSTVVIITTGIEGAPEDFEDKNILEAEKKLLKYILIQSYLTQRGLYKPEVPSSMILDGNTKVQWAEFMVKVTNKSFLEDRTIYENRKAMRLITVFSEEEFNTLIKKYFTDEACDNGGLEKNVNDGRLSTLKEVLTTGVLLWIGAMILKLNIDSR